MADLESVFDCKMLKDVNYRLVIEKLFANKQMTLKVRIENIAIYKFNQS